MSLMFHQSPSLHGEGSSEGARQQATPKTPGDTQFRSGRIAPPSQRIFSQPGTDEPSPRGVSPSRGGPRGSAEHFESAHQEQRRRVQFASPTDAGYRTTKHLGSQSPYDTGLHLRSGAATPGTEGRGGLPFESYDDDLDGGPMDYGMDKFSTGANPPTSSGKNATYSALTGKSVLQTPAAGMNTPGMSTPSGTLNFVTTPMTGGYGHRLSDTWVTVFGFRPQELSAVLQLFRNQIGEVLSVKHPRDTKANWVHIQYATIAQAERAMAKSGTIINGSTMIAVKPFEGPEDGMSGAETPAPIGLRTPGTQMRQYPMPTRDYMVEREHLPQAHASVWSRMMDYIFGI